MKTRLGFLCLFLVAWATSPALGHDYWVEPSSFEVAPGGLVLLDLRVGDEAPGQVLPFDPTHAETFILVGPEGQQNVLGRPGSRPAGAVRVGAAGPYTVAYGSAERSVTLSADRFDSYLREEGLEQIIDERKRRSEAHRPGRELFSRCAKSLLHVSGNASLAAARSDKSAAFAPIGLELELVPENDPATAFEVRLQVLLRGEPQTGLRVKARPLGDEATAVTRTTDSAGRVVFPVRAPGPWLITAVHMERADASPDHEWRSLWASLTFERADSAH